MAYHREPGAQQPVPNAPRIPRPVPEGLPPSPQHQALAAQIRRDEAIASAFEKLAVLLDRAIVALDRHEDDEPNEPTADGPSGAEAGPDWETVKVTDLAVGDVVEWFGNVAAILEVGLTPGRLVLRREGSTLSVPLAPDTSIRRQIRRNPA